MLFIVNYPKETHVSTKVSQLLSIDGRPSARVIVQ